MGIGVLAIGTLWLLSKIQAVLPPFIYALIFVYLLRPVVDGLEKRGVNRVLAIAIAYLFVIAILTILMLIVVPIVIGEIRSFITSLPVHVDYVKKLLIDVSRSAKVSESATLSGVINRISSSASEGAMAFAGRIPATAIDLFGGLINFILAPLIAFYILKDLGAIKRTIEAAIPSRYREEGMDILEKVDLVLGGFLKGQMLVALSVGVLVGASMAILGIKYALLIGIISAVFNIIPYLGPIASGIPAVLLALEKSPGYALLVIAVLTVVNQLDGLFISPNIMRQQVNLHPTVVIFALLVGGAIYGIVGLIVAIPVAAVGKAIYLHFREKTESANGTRALREV